MRMYRIEIELYDTELDMEIYDVAVVPEFALGEFTFTNCVYVGDLPPNFTLEKVKEEAKEEINKESKVVEIKRPKKKD